MSFLTLKQKNQKMLKLIKDGKQINRQQPEWIQGPIDYLNKHSRNEDLVLHLTTPIVKGKRSFEFFRKSSKISVKAIQYEGYYEIICKRRGLPTPDEIIPSIEVYHTEHITDPAALAEKLYEHLSFESIYKKGLYDDKKQLVTASPAEKYLYGGKVYDFYIKGNEIIVTTEHGMIYHLVHHLGTVVKPYDYVVMRNPSQYVFLNQLDFPNYFRAI
jgi:hypothetical protein